jgi:hypothetical protein
VQRDLGKHLENERGACNKRPGAHLTTDRTALPAGERKDFDVVCGELEQYPYSVVEVVGCGDVISYG